MRSRLRNNHSWKSLQDWTENFVGHSLILNAEQLDLSRFIAVVSQPFRTELRKTAKRRKQIECWETNQVITYNSRVARKGWKGRERKKNCLAGTVLPRTFEFTKSREQSARRGTCSASWIFRGEYAVWIYPRDMRVTTITDAICFVYVYSCLHFMIFRAPFETPIITEREIIDLYVPSRLYRRLLWPHFIKPCHSIGNSISSVNFILERYFLVSSSAENFSRTRNMRASRICMFAPDIRSVQNIKIISSHPSNYIQLINLRRRILN